MMTSTTRAAISRLPSLLPAARTLTLRTSSSANPDVAKVHQIIEAKFPKLSKTDASNIKGLSTRFCYNSGSPRIDQGHFGYLERLNFVSQQKLKDQNTQRNAEKLSEWVSQSENPIKFLEQVEKNLQAGGVSYLKKECRSLINGFSGDRLEAYIEYISEFQECLRKRYPLDSQTNKLFQSVESYYRSQLEKNILNFPDWLNKDTSLTSFIIHMCQDFALSKDLEHVSQCQLLLRMLEM